MKASDHPLSNLCVLALIGAEEWESTVEFVLDHRVAVVLSTSARVDNVATVQWPAKQ